MRMCRVLLIACLVSSLCGVAARAAERAGERPTEGCAPIETREPNATDQHPSFAGQTRVCAVKSNVAFDVVVLAKGLEKPWAVEPLPGGDLLVTEKPGRLRIVSAKGKMLTPRYSPALGALPAE